MRATGLPSLARRRALPARAEPTRYKGFPPCVLPVYRHPTAVNPAPTARRVLRCAAPPCLLNRG
jgi:hypothetical protein